MRGEEEVLKVLSKALMSHDACVLAHVGCMRGWWGACEDGGVHVRMVGCMRGWWGACEDGGVHVRMVGCM